MTAPRNDWPHALVLCAVVFGLVYLAVHVPEVATILIAFLLVLAVMVLG